MVATIFVSSESPIIICMKIYKICIHLYIHVVVTKYTTNNIQTLLNIFIYDIPTC